MRKSFLCYPSNIFNSVYNMVIPAVIATECGILSVRGKATAFFDLYLDQLEIILANPKQSLAML